MANDSNDSKNMSLKDMSLKDMSWEDVLSAPTFVINMDACPDRMELSEKRIRAAGYTDIRRISAIDARICDLKAEWAKYGSPQFAAWDTEFVEYPGKQCCLLSWLKVLTHITSEKIPFANIFEDDPLFHKDWHALAPEFYKHTPKDFHLCYMGSQIENYTAYSEICRAPVFCTNAFMYTLEGAQMVQDVVLNTPGGTYTIDCMLKNSIERGRNPFTYYVWNSTKFPDPARTMPKDWTKRNCGLVFQDYDMGTFVREW